MSEVAPQVLSNNSRRPISYSAATNYFVFTLKMRFSLPAVIALLATAQTATAFCCFSGTVGGCARALEDRSLRLRSDQLGSRAACCCNAVSVDACATHCDVSVTPRFANGQLLTETLCVQA